MLKLHLALLLSVAAVSTTPAFAQPDTLWTSTVLGNGNTTLYDGFELSVGGFVVAGTSVSSTTNNDFFVARLEENGAEMWSMNIAESVALEEVQGIAEDAGTIIIAGHGQVGNLVTGRYKLVLIGLSLEGDSLWYRSYESTGQAKARDIVPLSDGNFAVVGYALGVDNTSSDVWLLKCTSTGDTLWTRRFGGTQTDVGQQVQELSNGDLLILANTRSDGEGQYDLWAIHTDASGNEISDETYGTVAEEIGYGMAVDVDGTTYLAGRQGVGTGYLVIAPPSEAAWQQTYTEDGDTEQIRGILIRFLSLIGAGFAGPSLSNTAPLLIGLDMDGEAQWSWMIGEPNGASAFYGVCSTDGGLAYGTLSVNSVLRGFAMRIAPEGGIQGFVTDRDTGAPLRNVFVRAANTNRYAVTDPNGFFVMELVAGTYDLHLDGPCVESDTVLAVEVLSHLLSDVALQVSVPLAYNMPSSVNLIAENHIPSVTSFRLNNAGGGVMTFGIETTVISPAGDWLSVDPAAGTVPPDSFFDVQVIVSADTLDVTNYDYFGTLTLHTNACPDTVREIPVLASVLDAENAAAGVISFALYPAYPNPFNSETSLRFDVPAQTRVTLALYDVSGRLVRTLTDRDYAAGSHTVSVVAADLAAGMYFARLQAGEQSAVRKLLYLK